LFSCDLFFIGNTLIVKKEHFQITFCKRLSKRSEKSCLLLFFPKKKFTKMVSRSNEPHHFRLITKIKKTFDLRDIFREGLILKSFRSCCYQTGLFHRFSKKQRRKKISHCLPCPRGCLNQSMNAVLEGLPH